MKNTAVTAASNNTIIVDTMVSRREGQLTLCISWRTSRTNLAGLMAAIGLFPAALSHGIGSESSRPLARVVIGGILFAMIFSLWVFPLIFNWAYRKVDTKHNKQVDNKY
jgi:cobalt-zinc-cadmium resistance protein CzcA